VQSVSFAQLLPWWESHDATISLPGSNVPDLRLGIHASYNAIAPNFLATLQIPMLQGRDFSSSDRKDSPRVTIVNQSLANRLWLGQAAVGQTLMINAIEHTVVGVARDAQYNPASDLPHLAFYLPYWQYRDGGDARFFIRTTVNPGPMLRQLKLAIRGIDPNVPVGEDATMVEALLSDFGPLRLTRAVLVFTGAVALFLSAIGLYSVLAFLVVQRTREIGIRMALGATRQGILGVFLKQGMQLALAGALAGSIAALASARLLSSLLYGVSPQDPGALIVVASILMIACSLASYIPARRATKVDPMVALRYE
jgi:predicted permease